MPNISFCIFKTSSVAENGEREEEEEQVFIASAKGRNGPKDPYTPEHDIRKFSYQRYIHRVETD